MNVQAPKKLSLKKETLRQIDATQLDGAVGGSTPVCITVTIIISATINRELNDQY
ncbi:class I lanthipeptide [Comamonas sp. JC664]|uniref:class I lanthipeptide n=1 Tax=Comamonas sp. JC664 TaxID=2801917 RepID=UPI001748CE39|nr:class I lanthipeptide [Comamonas sp. JC664]MBL0697710.1 class I lanthipeptide [Comamonas sp. JC664]GHG69137.1 hypothetical protein GCM10012319_13030 [Comamonas sp. KCTC 72670]